MNGSILVFDGHCNLCNHTVQFILRREVAPTLTFASATSAAGAALARRSGIPDAPDMTFLLVENGEFLDRSEAALALTRHLKAPWRWLRCLKVVPRPVRDAVYKLIARNRYRVFGRRAACMVPDAHVQARFLD